MRPKLLKPKAKNVQEMESAGWLLNAKYGTISYKDPHVNQTDPHLISRPRKAKFD